MSTVEDSTLTTVPIEGAEPVVHDQLPSLEEVKTEKEVSERSLGGAAETGSRRRRLRRLVYILVPLVLVALIIGLAVGLTNRNNNSSTTHDSLQSGGTSNNSPNASPVTDRLTTTIQFLQESGISDPNSFQDQKSPQYQAALWMANYDPLHLSLSNQGAFLQRYVVVVLYYALNFETWGQLLGWLSNTSECSWSSWFATETLVQNFEGIVCNNASQLTELHLSTYNIVEGKNCFFFIPSH